MLKQATTTELNPHDKNCPQLQLCHFNHSLLNLGLTISVGLTLAMGLIMSLSFLKPTEAKAATNINELLNQTTLIQQSAIPKNQETILLYDVKITGTMPITLVMDSSNRYSITVSPYPEGEKVYLDLWQMKNGVKSQMVFKELLPKGTGGWTWLSPGDMIYGSVLIDGDSTSITEFSLVILDPNQPTPTPTITPTTVTAATATPVDTLTPTPVDTFTPTPLPTATATPIPPTATDTATFTPTPTAATNTPTATHTATFTPTPTDTPPPPSATPTPTATKIATPSHVVYIPVVLKN